MILALVDSFGAEQMEKRLRRRKEICKAIVAVLGTPSAENQEALKSYVATLLLDVALYCDSYYKLSDPGTYYLLTQ